MVALGEGRQERGAGAERERDVGGGEQRLAAEERHALAHAITARSTRMPRVPPRLSTRWMPSAESVDTNLRPWEDRARFTRRAKGEIARSRGRVTLKPRVATTCPADRDAPEVRAREDDTPCRARAPRGSAPSRRRGSPGRPPPGPSARARGSPGSDGPARRTRAGPAARGHAAPAPRRQGSREPPPAPSVRRGTRRCRRSSRPPWRRSSASRSPATSGERCTTDPARGGRTSPARARSPGWRVRRPAPSRPCARPQPAGGRRANVFP